MVTFEKKSTKVQIGMRIEEEILSGLKEIKKHNIGYSMEHIINEILRDYLKQYFNNKNMENK